MSQFTDKSFFLLRFKYLFKLISYLRNAYYLLAGMQIGRGTFLPPIYVTWPHQVSLGSYCNLEHGIYFKYDGIWSPGHSILIGKNVFIGSNCEFNIKVGISIADNSLIASGCRFIDHDHGTSVASLMRTQDGPGKEIIIEEDVWIGVNAVVLKGVTIGRGAIIGAGAVLNKSVAPFEIWAGVPAKKIGDRK